jgi:hypothetical protein
MLTISWFGSLNYPVLSTHNQAYSERRTTNLARSHILDEFPNYPCAFLLALLFEPFRLPESVCGKVVEDEHRRRETERFLGHCAVRDEVGVLPSQAKHPRRGLSTDAI